LKFSALALTVLLAACGGTEAPPAAVGGASASRQGGPALRIDQVPDLERLRAERRAKGERQGGPGDAGLQVDVRDREAVRQFFNGIYLGVPEAPMNWTGSYLTGAAGTVGKAYQDSTLLRINWFRAMAGVPANATLSDQYNVKDQEAAMMMSVNGELSHFPPTSWKNYTAAGADGAGHSNLALYAGVAAVDSYIMDYGASNGPLGHRRWLFYPQTREFGSGSVPGGTINGVTYQPANALWTVTGDYGATRPKVRDDYVAWPPQGFVPYQVVYNRWSLSYPDADFSQAKAVVTLAGANVPLVQEEVHNGYGENTLAWRMPAISEFKSMSKPASDQRYSVTVSNVIVQGKPVTYSYDVTVFDPATPTPGAARTTVLPPTLPALNQPVRLAVQAMAGATGYEIRQYQSHSLGEVVYNAANAAGVWIPKTSGGYDSLAGPVFTLRHADFQDQSLTFGRQLFAGAQAGVKLTRATGYLDKLESLHIQASEDDGASWNDVYVESGFSQPTGARQVQASLSAYAGRKIKLRLLVTHDGAVTLCADCGWKLSDISFSDVSELLNERSYTLPAGGAISANIGQAGDYLLFGRTQYQSLYYTEWGPGTAMYVDGAVFTGKRANYSIVKTDAGYVFTDTVGADGVQVVRNPFRLDFVDTSLAFDVEGNAGKAYRLYQAAFQRKPDLSGMGFWIKVLDGGTSDLNMAAGFTASPEFKQLYGSAPTKDQLIKAMYANTLNRAPDAEGYSFWMDALNKGLSTEAMLLFFADSPENRLQTKPATALGIEYIRN
jgi:hypothetical protein